jgi:hypothetical protein
MISIAPPPRNRGSTDQHENEGDRYRDKLGAAGNLLMLGSGYVGTGFTSEALQVGLHVSGGLIVPTENLISAKKVKEGSCGKRITRFAGA